MPPKSTKTIDDTAPSSTYKSSGSEQGVPVPISQLSESSDATAPSSSKGKAPDSSTLTDDSSLADYEMEISLIHAFARGEYLTIDGDRRSWTVKDASKIFAENMHKTYGMDVDEVKAGIGRIAPYIPLRRYRDGHGKLKTALTLPEECGDTMAEIFPNKKTHAILLFEMKDTFVDPRTVLVQKVKAQKAESDSMAQAFRVQQKALLEVVAKLQEEQLAIKEHLQVVEEKMRVDRERLMADLQKERERATQAEKALEETTVSQAEKIEDTEEFIANGCREDTAAYYRIKVRHLVNLTQGRLAYCVGMTSTPDKRDGPRKWRQYCKGLSEVEIHGVKQGRVLQMEAYIRKHCRKENKTAAECLIRTGALNSLVDDSSIRAAGDAAAHPGPLTLDNAEGYRTAVRAHANSVKDEELETRLNGCVIFLLQC